MIHRAIRRLFFLLKLIPFDTLTVRSVAIQAFNQPSKCRNSFKTGPINTQSTRRSDELTVECSWIRTTNQYLTVNIVIVSRDVIEDASRYSPQPTCLSSLFWKVIKEKMPLMKPVRNITMVIPAVSCIITDWFQNILFGWIWLRKMSLIVKPLPFVYKLHWSPTTQLLYFWSERKFLLIVMLKRLTYRFDWKWYCLDQWQVVWKIHLHLDQMLLPPEYIPY